MACGAVANDRGVWLFAGCDAWRIVLLALLRVCCAEMWCVHFFDFALSCRRLLGFCTDAASFYSFAGGALPAFWICVVRLVICGDNWAERQLPKALLYERQNFRVRWFSTEGVFTHRKVILFDTFEDADPERCVEKYRERERRLLHIGPSFAKDGQRRDNPGGAGYLPHECETAGLPTGSRAQRHFAFLSLPQPWLHLYYISAVAG